jgi:casein kinase II subunit beta
MDLYGLIHARFIISSRGLHIMRAKFLNGVFGACPRVLCDRQLVLPVGMSEDLSISRVKVSYHDNLRYIVLNVKKFMYQE